jgi:hypothetical protein
VPSIFDQIEHKLHPGHDDIPAVPTTQENPMTQQTQQQAQPQPRVTATLHALTGEIDSNRLASELIERNLGTRLSASEIGTVLTFVDAIEQPRRPVAANTQQQQ